MLYASAYGQLLRNHKETDAVCRSMTHQSLFCTGSIQIAPSCRNKKIHPQMVTLENREEKIRHPAASSALLSICCAMV